ncbi:hypothetical protein PFY12_14765 [Chryseobacterium camelliae]|uniref:Uncharacterized protein n=1 Tax=Chryseobacterium camelliae TaxID=1265445 RepID=A0ABY7QKT7_9FLAO|nr:hypothetical protein [Chryseobacterium camelliae]WBV60288.1 hypothetical protein PFY12_14765 [Chryseobacterium camelliae]
MIASGLLPFLDILLISIFPNIETIYDVRGSKISTDIWVITLYFSPVLIVLGSQMEPLKFSLHFPLFAFTYTGVMYCLPMLGIDIEPDWFIRLLFFIAVIPVTLLVIKIGNIVADLKAKEEIQYNTIRNISEKQNEQ